MEINQSYSVEIKESFTESTKGILEYIRQNSYQNALLFEKEIVEKIYQICENPEAFPLLRKIKTKRQCRFAIFKKSYEIFYYIDQQNVKINFLDIGAGASINNKKNLFFGLNVKHINRPETSFNGNASNIKDLFLSVQSGIELDINKYDQGLLPYYSYLYLNNSFSKQGSKTRFDLYQEAILGNVGFGLNQHFNNFNGFTVSQFGTSLSVFIEEIEIGANYSFEIGKNKFTGTPYNTFEMYLIFDFNPFKKNRRGDNSRFYDMQ